MQCKSLWIKASAKCINVNVNYIHQRIIGLRQTSLTKQSLDVLFMLQRLLCRARSCVAMSTYYTHLWEFRLKSYSDQVHRVMSRYFVLILNIMHLVLFRFAMGLFTIF